jgi:hypothetical protein
VLRAVVSTPSVPVLVIRQDPSRQPSADVVVVAGAVGAVPVGLGAGVGETVGVSDASEGVGDSDASDGESVGVTIALGEELAAADPLPTPTWPHTAPTMSPTTAATATATPMIAPAGIEPRESSRRGITRPD